MQEYLIDPKKLAVIDYSIGAIALGKHYAVEVLQHAAMTKQILSGLTNRDFIEVFDKADRGAVLHTDSEECATLFSFVAASCKLLNSLVVDNMAQTGLPKVALRIQREPRGSSKTFAYLETNVLKEYWACLDALACLASFLPHKATPVGLYRKYTLELLNQMPAIVEAFATTRTRTVVAKPKPLVTR